MNSPRWSYLNGYLRIYIRGEEVAAIHPDQFPHLLFDIVKVLRDRVRGDT